MSALFDKHRALLARAQEACEQRHCWSPYPDMPAKYPDAEAAQARGLAAFEAHLGRAFELDQPGHHGARLASQEISPYTQDKLGTSYPHSDIDALFAAATAAMTRWAQASIETRIGTLMEVLELLYKDHLFEVAHAVMHTAGQSLNMAYAGSGVNALDRGIEALVYAEQAMRAVTPQARWERVLAARRSAGENLPHRAARCGRVFHLCKFPTWNAWPSMLASLATGNPVIVKPHPATVLPMAISVRVFRRVLAAAGFDPNLVTLAVDSVAEPLGKVLVKHPRTAIVDFTGSVQFGQWVEQNAHPALAYTETAGCNTVVLESAEDLDAAIRSLATTLCMFSAQMCTSPQNIYVPRRACVRPRVWCL
jgi:phenylacetic acid degradation protein paaN